MTKKGFIDNYGIFVTIIVSILGVTLFSFPKLLMEYSGTNGWIVTIIAGGIACCFAYLIYHVIKLNNYDKLFIILSNNFGVILARIVSMIFCFFSLVIISSELRAFTEMIKMYLLEKTPIELIMLIFILSGTYLVRGDLKSLLGFNGVTFWVMFVPIIIAMFLTVGKGDMTNFLPILQFQDVDYFKGVRTAMYGFGGFEILFLLIPNAKDKIKGKKVIKWSFLFIVLVYCLTIFFTVAIFSTSKTKILLWPTFTMIRSLELPGAIIEHWEGIILSFFIMFYFTTFVNIFYFAADLVKDAFKLYDVKLTTIILTPLMYILALVPSNISEVRNLEGVLLPILAFSFLIMLPVVLFIITKIRSKLKDEKGS